MYRCSDCDFSFKAAHSIGDKLTDCPTCNTVDTLIRVPTSFTTDKEPDAVDRVGSVVRSSIEEFREELVKEKQQLSTQEYKE